MASPLADHSGSVLLAASEVRRCGFALAARRSTRYRSVWPLFFAMSVLRTV
jgi:hypothetical protein